jgi:serine protease Do
VIKRIVPIAALIICLLITSCVVIACDNTSDEPAESPNPTPSQTVEQNTLPCIADVVAQVKPAVVAINVEAISYDMFNRTYREQGAGSGWIIDEDGHIVTNNHVVEGADTITVTLDDGRVLKAEEVSTDPLTDLAVIKIDARDLPVLKVGDSSASNIGEWVVVIGNSLGRGISATQGIVSSTQVSLAVSPGQTLDDLIQTDAAINPGNSGGPLVNMAGEVIGITSVKVAEVGVEGMGYAISSNEAMPVIAQLIEMAYVLRPSLGISTATVDRRIAVIYRLPVSSGVLITEMLVNGPADQAGLKPGDVIIAVDGEEIQSANDFTRAIISKEISQTVEITYWRGKAQHETSATLVEAPSPNLN